MRVLVTGGAGFIGGNLVRALVRRGDEVVVFDNLVTFGSLRAIEDVLDRVEFLHGDIRCPEDVERTGDRPFDRVYHLAASFANELSLAHPALDMQCNLVGTINVLAHARRVGCGSFVYTGTSSSYGDGPVPFAEDALLRPQTPYATSKYLGEVQVAAAGLPFAILRLFNVYGPGDPPGPYRNAIPNMMRALEAPSAALRVFGREATRDFTYVDDVVDVLLAAERAHGQVVNVGSGTETRIVDLAAAILRLFALSEERMVVEAPRSWDRVVRRCASVRRLESLFGRLPETTLAVGLAETARWLHRNGYLSRVAP